MKVTVNKHNVQKKIAIINDMTGFGRCSLTVEIPIISKMGIQCCPIPTSILSNHTAYESYFFKDFTDYMDKYVHEWKKLGLEFQGILTGYLGSIKQFEMIERIIHEIKSKKSIIVVDPVMGDDGKLYSSYTNEMSEKMRELVKNADIITPNLTEARLLLGISEGEKIPKVEEMLEKLLEMGPKKVVITGVEKDGYILNYCKEAQHEVKIVKAKKIGESRAGTGDVFSAIIAADAINGEDFYESVKKANDFLMKCIKRSMEYEIPIEDGVCFEEFLGEI
ncbi:pyridoxine kinase [Lachnospiraceae bacterium C7]|nr:pyridoxine kinase [Lachnospiraceae bacterium C7]